MKRKTPQLVAIVGGSGAGKSLLAARLEAVFPGTVRRICLDDFYLDRSHLPPGRRARLNFDRPQAIDWPLLERVLSGCLAGHKTALPAYDFSRHARAPRLAWFKPTPIVVVEGLWLLRRPGIRRLFAHRIFIECPPGLRFRRRLRRDQAERGRDRRSISAQFHGQVLPAHERYIEPQRRLADIVISSPFTHSQLRLVLDRIGGLIRSTQP